MKHQTMLVNENRLNLADQRARQYLARQMENFFFGAGAEQPAGYVPPTRLRSALESRSPVRLRITRTKGFDVASLQELMAQKEALERQIEQTKKQERGEAIEKVRALMAEYGLTVADLGGKARAKAQSQAGSGNKVAAKYRDAATGESWSGRGLQPRWLKAALASGTQAHRLRGLTPSRRRCGRRGGARRDGAP